MSSIPYRVKEVIELLKTFDIYIIPRRDNKNFNFMASIGIDEEDAIEFIRLSLKEAHCVRELLKDRDYLNNYLYVFKIRFMNHLCYIKLTVSDDNKVIKVISFHEDEEVQHERD